MSARIPVWTYFIYSYEFYYKDLQNDSLDGDKDDLEIQEANQITKTAQIELFESGEKIFSIPNLKQYKVFFVL